MKKVSWIFLSVCFLSCYKHPGPKWKIDEFYTETGGFDFSRIPLAKPFEAVVAIPGDNWIVHSIDSNSVTATMPGTKEVNVADSLIFLHCTNTILNFQPIGQAWFIIYPGQQIVKGFETKEDYLNYLKLKGIKEPELYDIRSVLRYFQENNYVDWRKVE